MVATVVTAPDLTEEHELAVVGGRAVTYFQIPEFGELLAGRTDGTRPRSTSCASHPMLENLRGAADSVFTKDQLAEVSRSLPPEWLTEAPPSVRRRLRGAASGSTSMPAPTRSSSTARCRNSSVRRCSTSQRLPARHEPAARCRPSVSGASRADAATSRRWSHRSGSRACSRNRYPGIVVTSFDDVECKNSHTTKLRVRLDLNDVGVAAGIPEHVCLKANWSGLRTGLICEREARFYHLISDGLACPVPTPYYADWDDDGRGNGLVVMEDLGVSPGSVRCQRRPPRHRWRRRRARVVGARCTARCGAIRGSTRGTGWRRRWGRRTTPSR